jgi:hypothetical protein
MVESILGKTKAELELLVRLEGRSRSEEQEPEGGVVQEQGQEAEVDFH